MDRDQRLERTQAARTEAIVHSRPVTGQTPDTYIRDQYAKGITDEFRRAGAFRRHSGARGRRRGDLLQLPPGSRASASRGCCSTPALDPDDDDPFTARTSTAPRSSASRRCPTRSRRSSPGRGSASSTSRRPRSTRHVTYFFNGGIEAGVGGRDAHSRPEPAATSRATTRSRRCRPAEVTERFCDEIGNGYRFRRRQLRQPRHGRPHGRDPGRRRPRSRRPTAAWGRWPHASPSSAGSALITADHGNAEQLLEPDGISPHTAHTTKPGALDRDDKREVGAPAAKLCRSRTDRARPTPNWSNLRL